MFRLMEAREDKLLRGPQNKLLTIRNNSRRYMEIFEDTPYEKNKNGVYLTWGIFKCSFEDFVYMEYAKYHDCKFFDRLLEEKPKKGRRKCLY